MSKVEHHKPMLTALIFASVFQFCAIVADQYVLNLDFTIEKMKHSISSNENLQRDLENTVEVMRFAYRYDEDMSMKPFFDKRRNYNKFTSIKDPSTIKNLDFMKSEISKIYEIYGIDIKENLNDSEHLLEFAQPLFEKIDTTAQNQFKMAVSLAKFEDRRHLTILMAVIAQIAGLVSLLGYFIFELNSRDLKRKQRQ